MIKKKLPINQISEDIDEEERELFLNAFFQNFSIKDKKTSPDTTNSKKSPQTAEESDEELFLCAVNEGNFYSYEKKLHSSLAQSKSPRRNKKDQRNKRDAIDARIDLHGLYAEDAVERLLNFIYREKKRGSKILLVVHGKGTGVLKKAAWAVVETSDIVNDYQVAPSKYGGEGAIILKINQKFKRS
ncbi:MAG: Smr/MutS family protein [Myxococcales bacterium]|nr:Smr/MutS family protein [Myxococcales bacterium]USN50955.1 MAG: Smr/MutS family protein [Myxococcales bacterium]